MIYKSECFQNDASGAYAWVEQRNSPELNGYVYVVMLGEIKEGLDVLKNFLRGGGTYPAGAIKSIMVETAPYSSGEPAFRYALEYTGKDPTTAREQYEKFLSLAREIPALDPNYRPRRDNEKER